MTRHYSNAMQTYRRIEFDARVEGASGIALTRLCLEQAIDEIDRAERSQDRHPRAAALTRASAAISALSSGVDKANPLYGPLTELYGSAERAVRAAVFTYNEGAMKRVRGDLRDILALI